MFIPQLNPDGTYQVALREIPFATNPEIYCKGSYNVLAARLLGFTYPDYLRYCRSLGGILRGREGYTYCVFKDRKVCANLCARLDKEFKRVEEGLK